MNARKNGRLTHYTFNCLGFLFQCINLPFPYKAYLRHKISCICRQTWISSLFRKTDTFISKHSFSEGLCLINSQAVLLVQSKKGLIFFNCVRQYCVFLLLFVDILVLALTITLWARLSTPLLGLLHSIHCPGLFKLTCVILK